VSLQKLLFHAGILEETMEKKTGIITAVLAALSLCMSLISLARTLIPSSSAKKDVQYVLYLGTNDKDSNQPVFPPETAEKELEKILIQHFGGYTISDARGGWVDGDTTYQEYTLVIYLSDTDMDAVHAACRDMINTFHQSSVLIQANETTTEFYDGN
jgi:hypothetical protein